MADLGDFTGTWIASRGAPFSNHRFTWQLEDDRLQGRWIIETANAAAARAVAATGQPTRIEWPIGECRLDGSRVLFQQNGGPFVSEFRLVSDTEAVVGAAIDQLPSEFVQKYRKSIEGHRVTLRRQGSGR
jgi:hypothetical protein